MMRHPDPKVLNLHKAFVCVALLALAACQRNPLVVERSLCPAVAIPTFVGDVTLFNPASSRDASAVDVTATITNLRGACDDGAATVGTRVSFDVIARRSGTAGARTVTLPFFVSMVQGGNLLVSKQLGSVTVSFADGQARAVTQGAANARVSRAAATVNPDIQAKISRKRKAGDLDAAIDPLADPEVRAAIRATTFEVLVGFQLDEAALAYNVTK